MLKLIRKFGVGNTIAFIWLGVFPLIGYVWIGFKYHYFSDFINHSPKCPVWFQLASIAIIIVVAISVAALIAFVLFVIYNILKDAIDFLNNLEV